MLEVWKLEWGSDAASVRVVSVHLQTEEHLFTKSEKIWNNTTPKQQRLLSWQVSSFLTWPSLNLSLQMLLLQMTSGLPQLPSLNGFVISAEAVTMERL